LAVFHVVERDAGGVELSEPRHQIVAGDRGDLDRLAVELRHLEQRGAAAERIDPARVRDHADAARDQRRQRLLDLGDEVAGVPGPGVANPLLLHDGHRDLGQEIERHEIHRAELDLAPELREIVPPVASSVGDPDGIRHGAAG